MDGRRRRGGAFVARAGELLHQLGYGAETSVHLGGGAGVAFVQHQVGLEAQRLQLVAQAGRQLVLKRHETNGLAEVAKAGASALVLVAQHSFEQLAQARELVGGRGGGVGGEGSEAGEVAGRHKNGADYLKSTLFCPISASEPRLLRWHVPEQCPAGGYLSAAYTTAEAGQASGSLNPGRTVRPAIP